MYINNVCTTHWQNNVGTRPIIRSFGSFVHTLNVLVNFVKWDNAEGVQYLNTM